MKSLFTFHLQLENSKHFNTSWSTGSFIRRHVPECALFTAVEIVKGKRGSGETLAVSVEKITDLNLIVLTFK